MKQKHDQKIQAGADLVALYHIVYRNETFEQSAQAIFKIVQEAQKVAPDKKRILYLDIEGHRNKAGGYDSDMFELQKEFLVGFMMRFLTEVHGPMASITNPKPQDNNVPASLMINAKPSA